MIFKVNSWLTQCQLLLLGWCLQYTSIVRLCLLTIPNITVNREIFVYENIHVLNIRVNKFSRVPHENVLTQKFVKLKLLCRYRQLSDY